MSRKNHRLVFILAVAAVASIGAPVAAQRPVCQDQNNLTTNCGFDTNILGWTQGYGYFSWEPTDGNEALGSMEVLSEHVMVIETIRFDQCVVGVAANMTYGFGGFVKVVSGTPPFSVKIEVTNFDSTNCAGNGSSTPHQISAFSSQWDQMNWTLSTDADTQSVLIDVTAISVGTGSFTLRFDDLFLGESLVPVELQSFTVE